MSGGGGNPVGLVIGLVAGTIAYLFFTAILSMILGVAPVDIFTSPLSGAANSLVTGWVVLGGLLGIADLLAIFRLISLFGQGM